MKRPNDRTFYLALAIGIALVMTFMIWIAWGLATFNDTLNSLT